MAQPRSRAVAPRSTAFPDPPLNPDSNRPGTNLPEFTVGALARAVKRTIEDGFGYVRVRGEISQPKFHSSGHLYLRLKDENAVIEAVCWRGTVQKLSIRPEEGMEVVCTGRLTTYPGRSQYQLVIEAMELAGEGALLKMLEERKRRLAAEGLFEADRKKRLPFLPEVIGVVTSPTGAVIRDILHRLADRFPRRVLLWQVAVQGDQAAAQVAAAIEGFNRLRPNGLVPRPDTLIVARGGGSLEDLMPFNEEIVVRAAAASAIPLIAAVGHETDTTLIDLAADLRAPTPTAAAELAVPVRAELVAQVLDLARRQVSAADRLLAERRNRVEGLGRGLGDPVSVLEAATQRLDDRAERLTLAMTARLTALTTAVGQLGNALRHPRELLADAKSRLAAESRALTGLIRHRLEAAMAGFGLLAPRLSADGTARRIADAAHTLAATGDRLDRLATRHVADADARLRATAQLLESLSYRNVLNRGYAVVRDTTGTPVTAAANTAPGLAISLEFHDGKALARVDGEMTPPQRQPRSKRRREPQQPKLL